MTAVPVREGDTPRPSRGAETMAPTWADAAADAATSRHAASARRVIARLDAAGAALAIRPYMRETKPRSEDLRPARDAVSQRDSKATKRCGYSGPMYSARGRMRRLFAYCSRTCAVQPDTRLTAKIGVKSSIA